MGRTSKLGLTSSAVDSPVKTSALLGSKRDLVGAEADCGMKCCESSQKSVHLGCLLRMFLISELKGADDVLAGLEAEGYTCWACVVGAWAVGASHNRNRLWILAHRGSGGECWQGNLCVSGIIAAAFEQGTAIVARQSDKVSQCEEGRMADTRCAGLQARGIQSRVASDEEIFDLWNPDSGDSRGTEDVADIGCEGLAGERLGTSGAGQENAEYASRDCDVGDSEHDGLVAFAKSGIIDATIRDNAQGTDCAKQSKRADSSEVLSRFPAFRGQPQYAWEAPRRIERSVAGTDDGVSPRMDRINRIKSLGNSVVPQVVECFGRFIVQADRMIRSGQ